MNPVRYLREDWPPWLVGLFVLTAAILAVALWARIRERRGDWGPGLLGAPAAVGYAPADLRETAAATPIDDPHERWLLGLAAPCVEQAGLLHDRWSLVPAFCDAAWRRRLAEVASQWDSTRSRDWRSAVTRIERQLQEPSASPVSAESRAWLLAHLAMLLRVGVAARHTSAPRARRRLLASAAATRADYDSWLGYGNAFIASAEHFQPGRTAEVRADLRTLYAPGGPWHDIAWP